MTAARVRPAVELEIGPAVPAHLLRIVAVLAGGGATALVASGVATAVVLAALLLLTLVRPRSVTRAVWFAALALALVARDQVAEPDLALVLLGAHLALVSAHLLENLGWRSLVSRAVLRARWRSFLPVQLAAQAVGLAGWALTGSVSAGAGSSAITLSLVAMIGLGAVAWLLVRRPWDA